MSEIKQQLLVLLSEMAFVPRGIRGQNLARNARRFGSDGTAETVGAEYNTNSDRPDVIKAVLTAAFAGNYAFAKVEEPTREGGGPPRKSVSCEGKEGRARRWGPVSLLTSLEHFFFFYRSRPFTLVRTAASPFIQVLSCPRQGHIIGAEMKLCFH